jgi:hypothetical protein
MVERGRRLEKMNRLRRQANQAMKIKTFLSKAGELAAWHGWIMAGGSRFLGVCNLF